MVEAKKVVRILTTLLTPHPLPELIFCPLKIALFIQNYSVFVPCVIGVQYNKLIFKALQFAVSLYCLICQAQNKQITNSTKQNIIRHLHCLNFFVVNNFFALFCVYLLFICTFVLLIKKHTAMKATIKKSDFSFMPAGFGHYKVTYTSPATLKTWSKVISFMPLIDKTANSEAPLLKDLKELRRLAKS